MPLDSIQQNVDDLVAHKKHLDQESRKNARPRRKNERLLWVMAGLLMAGSALLYAWQTRTPPDVPVTAPPGLQLQGLGESSVDGGKAWVVEGVLQNDGPAVVSIVTYGFQYSDARHRIVSVVLFEARDLGVGEKRRLRLFVPGYEPGLTRTVVPQQVVVKER